MDTPVTIVSKCKRKIHSAILRWGRRFRGKRVAMLHPGRCGSTVLGRMLEQHSQIDWAFEVFEKDFPNLASKQERLRYVQDTIAKPLVGSQKHVFGFETKTLPHLHLHASHIGQSIDEYVRLLKSLSFNKFIIIWRGNYLRRAISLEVGHLTSSWHSKEAGKLNRIELPIDQFFESKYHSPMTLIESFRIQVAMIQQIQRLLANQSCLFLNYEVDIENDPKVAYRKVCKFLDVKEERVSITLRKTNPFPVREILVNYGTVASALCGTEFEWMLSDLEK